MRQNFPKIVFPTEIESAHHLGPLALAAVANRRAMFGHEVEGQLGKPCFQRVAFPSADNGDVQILARAQLMQEFEDFGRGLGGIGLALDLAQRPVVIDEERDRLRQPRRAIA